MKHEDFGDHELHCVQKWVQVILEGSDAHKLEDSQDKGERGEVVVEYDACETPIHATTQGDINALLSYG